MIKFFRHIFSTFPSGRGLRGRLLQLKPIILNFKNNLTIAQSLNV